MGTPPLMGLARLMTLSCHGVELTDIAKALLARVKENPADANALMDISIISHLWFKHDIGLNTQARALQIQRLYHFPATGEKPLRVLALMVAGDLAANTPLEFLLQNSNFSLDLLYIDPLQPFPEPLPEHDLIFVAVGESSRSRPVLDMLAHALSTQSRPVLNHPDKISRLSRDNVSRMLHGVSGIEMPLSAYISRDELILLGQQSLSLSSVIADGVFPIIVRPLDSHAGHGLEKIDAPEALAAYLAAHPETQFCISRFVDYRNGDGWYRKYRVVLVDGKAYAGHMAISEHWMIHYLNAHMSSNQQKRDEEARFMQQFDLEFGARHADALHAINQAAGLDYLVIDCAETVDGKLLVFEIDSAAVIHAMDPIDMFPYKHIQAQKIFSAFAALLTSRIEKSSMPHAE